MALRFCFAHNNYESRKGKRIVDAISSSFDHWVRGDPERIFHTYGVPARTANGITDG
jgi:hypothetical protein